MKLVLFDVDGTLTNTNRVDELCLIGALESILGVRNLSHDWSSYAQSTDSGIVAEVVTRVVGHEDADVVARVRHRFFDLMEQSYTEQPELFAPVQGAQGVFGRLRQSGYAVAIATGAWHESARFKMRVAGVDMHGVTMATGDDHTERALILQLAVDRVRRWDGHEPDHVVYVGDGNWDIAAATALGYSFIGIAQTTAEAERLTTAGAQVVLPNLVDLYTHL
jgi:phosphoglycolate phosphatase-like HAD superfamily hydrolase